ncbi:hypothetical protein ACH47B_08860 [Rhodococcus sp. NPDC019627]
MSAAVHHARVDVVTLAFYSRAALTLSRAQRETLEIFGAIEVDIDA